MKVGITFSAFDMLFYKLTHCYYVKLQPAMTWHLKKQRRIL
jgi:hypothetical protein